METWILCLILGFPDYAAEYDTTDSASADAGYAGPGGPGMQQIHSVFNVTFGLSSLWRLIDLEMLFYF